MVLFDARIGSIIYIHRILTGTFIVFFTIIFVYFSKILVAIHSLFLGQFEQATEVLNPQWFLFIPSHVAFGVYDAYVNTVENNKLFESEQRNFLQKNYQQYRLKLSALGEEK